MTIYEYQIKNINGMEYRSHCNTYRCWDDALKELGYDQEEIDDLNFDQIKEICRKLGSPFKFDEIYANPDFIQLMLKDWNEIGFKLQNMKEVNCNELNEFLRAYSQEMETLMSNLVLEDKKCDWSIKTWIKSPLIKRSLTNKKMEKLNS